MSITRRELVRGSALLSGLAVLGLASEASARPSPMAEVARSVEAFRQAMIAGDGRRLTALASARLRFGHSNGLIQTRTEFVNAVVTKKEVFRSIRLSDRKITVAGQTAVARHTFAANILLEGKPISVKLKCMEVWNRQHGRWLLVARQAFKV